MTNNTTELALLATDYLDFNHPHVSEFARIRAGDAKDTTEIAVRLYYAVRDEIRYNPYAIELNVSALRASTTLQAGYAWCVPKAVLLAACCRAKGIPAMLGFADVKNHLTSQRLRDTMKTDVFAWHGYTSIYLNGKWVKATPAFNKELCEKANIFPLEFDGSEDSIYHEFDRAGQQHMEYLQDRGQYHDLPLEPMARDLQQLYGLGQSAATDDQQSASSFSDEVAAEQGN